MEQTTFIMGSRTTSNGTADPHACQADCAADDSCVGWTHRAGAQPTCAKWASLSNTAQTLWRPPAHDASSTSGVPRPSPLIGAKEDTLWISPHDANLTIRVYVDRQLSEGFWQHGRVAMTRQSASTAQAGMAVHVTDDSAVGATLVRAQAWRVGDIWVSPEEVLRTPRARA